NQLAYQMRDVDLDALPSSQVPSADMDHRTSRGDVALLWEEEAAREIFADVRADRQTTDEEPAQESGDEGVGDPVPSDIAVRVFNGTATPGLGAELDDHLAESGFDVTDRAENWVSRDLPQSEVRHGPGRAKQAAYVAEMNPASEPVE